MDSRRMKRCGLLGVYKRLYNFFGPQRWWPAGTRFEVIVGAILTQNTSWANVKKAVHNLKKAGALSFRSLEDMPGRRLARLIRPSGYYNIKARRLKNFIDYLSSSYGGSIKAASGRDTGILRKELLSVNGVGPETCDSILLYAMEKPVFVVDAYTRRIFSRHGLIKSGADYREIQRLFEDCLPQDVRMFNEYHALIVRLGKEMCKKVPLCKKCPLKDVGTITYSA